MTTWIPLVEKMFKIPAKKEGGSVEEISDEFVREERPNVVLERLADPEEIVNVVVFRFNGLKYIVFSQTFPW